MQIRKNEFSPIRHSRTALIAQLGQLQLAKLGVIARTSIVRYKNTKENIAQIGTELTGAKLWLSGDLGGDFSSGQMDWVGVTFDKSVTTEQRQGLGEILPHVFPVKWKSFQIAEGNIDTWTFDKDQAHATLNAGKTAEVRLHRFQGMSEEPAVLKNVKYWGTPRNDGFVMMPNDLEAYRKGPNAFEYKGANGFVLTFDMTSKDVVNATPKVLITANVCRFRYLSYRSRGAHPFLLLERVGTHVEYREEPAPSKVRWGGHIVYNPRRNPTQR